ncbi:MAG: hypothetical protein A3D92_01880 [Bacteroidetes bacterium RIFCSPHIGHO2_02_FULL_44_7]|nr:MAG: hypothetical protein A3D92_01880 [Bacteroidetes bacterium RIFCSPHIGHO2_02_FULL_44_7]
MRTTLLFTALLTLVFSACRKNYVCECTNADGDYYLQPLQAKMTESKAQSQCDLTEVLYGDLEFQCVAKEN